MITLKDIKTRRFSNSGNGYSTEEVDEFMKEMAETYEAVLIKNKELYTKAGVLVKQIEEYKNNEKLITDAIATSQKMANRITAETEEKISRDIANAENTAKKIVNKAKKEADELNEASKAKSTRIIEKAKLDASEIIDNANEKASYTIENAEQKADKMISKAKNEKAVYENEMAEFKNEFEIFKEKLALLYNKQLKNLNTLEIPKKIKSIKSVDAFKEEYDNILDSDDQLNDFVIDTHEQEKINNI